MKIISVSDYLQILNDTLSSLDPYHDIFVEGEVADYKVSQNKWVWFDLKDENGIMNCFTTVWQLKEPLEDGMKIRASGYSSIYKKSGKMSFQVKDIKLVGEGTLKKAYELLKKKLREEGLFDEARKRGIPKFPRKICLITSSGAAAYTDFIRILNNRWGGAEVDLLSVAVQGKDAIKEIANAFKWLNKHAVDYDVCVLTRGGGSMEDLIAFNSEEVARAVYSCKIPVICGIGHERDECLAEYVADIRASTPSNAAERIVPQKQDILGELDFLSEQLSNNFQRRITTLQHQVDQTFSLIEHKARAPLDSAQRLMVNFEHQFDNFFHIVEKNKAEIESYDKLLHNLDPRLLLSRGYGIVRTKNGLLRKSTDVSIGEEIMIELGKGSLEAEVTKLKN